MLSVGNILCVCWQEWKAGAERHGFGLIEEMVRTLITVRCAHVGGSVKAVELARPGHTLEETLWAWSSSATTATAPVPRRCATTFEKSIGPTWTDTRRR